MDGLIVVDKPAGPTSHDVVAAIRRVLREPRVGHTGTLDPLATGVLPLVIGKATRLARFLTASTKSYIATIKLGSSTDSHDAAGRIVGDVYAGPMPSFESVEHALIAFRGTHLQVPPRFSAKKIDGRRSHRMARAAAPAEADQGEVASPRPSPVPVTAHSLALVSIEGSILTVEIDCSAGFYVRTLAHEVGTALGTGAHLVALRRTRSGDATLQSAAAFAELMDPVLGPERAAMALIPMTGMLPHLPHLALTDAGERRCAHGQSIGPADVAGSFPMPGSSDGDRFRLLGPDGSLVGIAERLQGFPALHPAVVLM